MVAIEPAPENIECLSRNFKDEIARGRVIVYPKGVWDKDDFLTMNIDEHNSAADSFVINPEGSPRDRREISADDHRQACGRIEVAERRFH